MTETIDAQTFRTVLGRYPTGVTIVTAQADDGPVGMVIGSFGSVSLDPPLVMFLPATSSSTWPRIEAAGHFCANVMSERQLETSNRFFSKDDDLWDTLEWTTAWSGAPVIAGCLAYIDCEIDAVHPAGDHLIVVGAVRHLAVDEAVADHGPLIFFGGGYGRFGSLD